jgi:hypothetical protein
MSSEFEQGLDVTSFGRACFQDVQLGYFQISLSSRYVRYVTPFNAILYQKGSVFALVSTR